MGRFADQCLNGHDEYHGASRNALSLAGAIGQNSYTAFSTREITPNYQNTVQAWYNEVGPNSFYGDLKR